MPQTLGNWMDSCISCRRRHLFLFLFVVLLLLWQHIYHTFCRSCIRRADTRSSSSFLSRCFNASVCAHILLWNAMRISISSCSRCRRSLASATCVVSSLTYSQPSHNAKTHPLKTDIYSFNMQVVQSRGDRQRGLSWFGQPVSKFGRHFSLNIYVLT